MAEMKIAATPDDDLMALKLSGSQIGIDLKAQTSNWFWKAPAQITQSQNNPSVLKANARLS